MTVLDLEAGLPNDPKAEVLLACWTQGDGSSRNEWVRDRGWARVAADLRSDGLLVAHNARFELGWLLRDGVLSRGEIKDLEIWDTFLAEWVIAGNRPWALDLDSCTARYGLNVPKHTYIKSLFASKDFKQGKLSLLDFPRGKLLQYCKQDVRATKELYLKQKELIKERKQEHLLRQRHNTCVVLTDIATHGLDLDRELVEEAFTSTSAEFNAIRDGIVEQYEGVNLASPDQLGNLLYDTLGFEVPTVRGKECLTKTGKRKTDEGTLALLKPKTAEQREFLDKYFTSNKLSSLISKYLNYFSVACSHYGGKVYGEIRQGVAATHRLTSSGTPLLDPSTKKLKKCQLQNIPRELKKIFKAPLDDWAVVEADYGSLEFVVAADLCDDPMAKHDIINGDKSKGTDPHSNTARVLTENGEPTSRQDAKSSCVPLYSEILTREGWRSYDQVSVGTEVLTYNQDNDEMEWGKILELVVERDRQVSTAKFSGWKTVSTPNHRWYGRKRVDHGLYRSYDPKIFTTDSIPRDGKITTAGVLNVGTSLKESDAAVVGWIFTDGNLKISELTKRTSQGSEGQRRGCDAVIIQKKQNGIDHITSNLKASGIQYRKSRKDDNGCFTFRLKSEHTRDLLLRVGLTLDDPASQLPSWVLGLDKRSRQAFYDACYLAEGSTKNGRTRISQNKGPVQEAILLCGYTLGKDIRTQVVPNGTRPMQSADHHVMTFRSRGYIGTDTLVVEENEKREDVWCPRTENGTWVMKQGHTVTITGNTFSPLFGGMGKSKAEKIYVEYFKDRYKAITETQQGWARSVVESKSNVLKTPYGMRFYFPGTTIQRSGYVTNTTQISNYPIQGFATGEIVPIALRLIWEKIVDADWVKIVNTVHDSIILVCRKDRVSDLLAILKQAMLDDTLAYLEEEYQYKFSTPLSVEVKAGSHWGEKDMGKWEWIKESV